MVLTKIGQEIFRRGAPYISKFLSSDKLVLNKAWTGFKHKSSIVAGIRTGLFSGSVVGSLLNNDDMLDTGGSFQPFNPSSSQNKARGGRRRRYGRRYNNRCRPNKYSRRSYSGKRKRMRNRF